VCGGDLNFDGWRVGATVAGAGAVGPAAQIGVGDLHVTASGDWNRCNGGNFGNLAGTDEHSLGFAGNGTISGDYYNPNFLSSPCSLITGRSQDNSDLQSITDASGYNGTLNIFKGSHFPGFYKLRADLEPIGNVRGSGVAGLATKNNDHGLNVVWSALLPDLPTLTVGYAETGGTSSLLGSDRVDSIFDKEF